MLEKDFLFRVTYYYDAITQDSNKYLIIESRRRIQIVQKTSIERLSGHIVKTIGELDNFHSVKIEKLNPIGNPFGSWTIIFSLDELLNLSKCHSTVSKEGM